jgi:hypothetical protein
VSTNYGPTMAVSGATTSESFSGWSSAPDVEVARSTSVENRVGSNHDGRSNPTTKNEDSISERPVSPMGSLRRLPSGEPHQKPNSEDTDNISTLPTRTIQFGDDISERPVNQSTKALYIPPPWKRDRGEPGTECPLPAEADRGNRKSYS